MKDIGLKLFSLGIAVALYLFAHSQLNISVLSLVVPIEARNLPEGKVILLPTVKQAQVTIKGPSFLVREVAISPPAFTVDLPDELEANSYSVGLSAVDLSLPRSIDVMSVNPAEIEFIFDEIVTKKVPVETPTIGTIDPNLKMGSILLSPAQVEIKGAATEIRTIDSVKSEPLDLRTVTENSKKELKLRIPGQFSTTSADTVVADIQVISLTVERRFPDLAVEVRSRNGNNYQLDPERITLEVSGPKTTIEAIDPEKLIPFVRLEEDDSVSETQLGVSIDLPENVEIVQIVPEKVKLIPSVSNKQAEVADEQSQ